MLAKPPNDAGIQFGVSKSGVYKGFVGRAMLA